MNIFKIIYLLPFLFYTACCSFHNVRTDAKSFKDPLCNSKNINKILIYANVNDMEYRENIELQVVKYFIEKNYNCIAVRSIDIFLPTRKFDKQDILQKLKENSIDAVLIFTVSNLGYVEQKMTINQPYQTYGNVYKGGSNFYSYGSTTYGGPQTYNFTKPYLYATAELFDAETGDKLWTVQLNARGNAFADIDDTLYDAAETMVLQLNKDGIVKVKIKN